MECLLIADDLTGACDAAVQFTGCGLRCAVALDGDGGMAGADVLAVTTESRGLSLEEARQAIARTAERYRKTDVRILFKKIDSTLRGNAGAEIAATVEAFGCAGAMVTPAFPALGRTVVDGWLRVEGPGDFVPVELRAYLQAQGVDAETCVPVDAACDADLDAIVGSGCGRERILWAGSGGLAAALARSLPAGRVRGSVPVRKYGPVVFCIGSTHAATVAQRQRLVAERPACELSAARATRREAEEALEAGRNVVLEIPRGQLAEAHTAELLAGVRERCGALALSGGDTASHVCRALRVRGIELHDEVEAGIPWGTLRGGVMDGVAVATKSGGFGDSSAWMEITDFFACPKT